MISRLHHYKELEAARMKQNVLKRLSTNKPLFLFIQRERGRKKTCKFFQLAEEIIQGLCQATVNQPDVGIEIE